MASNQVRSLPLPVTDPPHPLIAPDQVWVNLTVTQQAQFRQTIGVICRELFGSLLRQRESEAPHE